MDQPTVLIISDDAAFSRRITARWRSEPVVPAFTLMSSGLCPGLDTEAFDAAIIGGLATQTLPLVIKAIDACNKPVVCVHRHDQTQSNQLPPDQDIPSRNTSRLAILSENTDGWMETVVLILNESLRASQALAGIKRLEQANSKLTRDAALGRYMLEMRHGLNNALTSVLGNSELLLLEPETLAPLAPSVRSQIDTIRNMALRMHEILQRFSSLEKELNIAERQAAGDGKTRAQAAGVI